MKRLLLVEDDDFIRELYEIQFKKSGYEIDVARDGQEGLDKLNEWTYDAVLLDIMMPKVDGVTVLEKLREKEKAANAPALPVIMLTNLGEETILNKCRELGMSGCIIKARFMPKEIVQEVAKVLPAEI